MTSLSSAVRNLDIGPEQVGVEVREVASGAVVGGALAALDEGVSEQHVLDALQSMLFAQLAASAKANRHQDPTAWYKTYQSTLETIGWIVTFSASFTRYLPQVTRYTISNVILDLFRPRTTPEELLLIRRTLAALNSEAAAAGQLTWECPSHTGGIGNFQFGLASEEDNVLTLRLGRFTFEVPKHVTRLALEEFGSEAKFNTSPVDMTLNEQVYAQVRRTVATRLESRMGLIAQLALT